MSNQRGAIELAGLTKSYDGETNVVQGVNLKIPNGAYCCFLGPSGCGKTTILRMIAGHEDPSDGEILIGGDNVVGLPPAERGTAMMFQSYALFPHLERARQHRLLAARARARQDRALSGRRRDDREGEADGTCATACPASFPAASSSASRSRAPPSPSRACLLLDEPLSALDEQLRIQMRTELRRMQRELGVTFVHVTHSQLEAIALADMVVVMEKGRIKQAGPARDVYAAPRDRYVAEFLGGQNVFSGRVGAVEGDVIRLDSAELKSVVVPLGAAHVSAGDRIDVAVRRDDINLHRPGAALGAGASSLASRVMGVEYQGNFVKVMLDAVAGDEFVVYVPERAFFEDPLSIGDVVMAAWAAERTRLLA